MIINAILPLRKKSTRIKNKNLKKIKNKPLYKFVLNEAVKCKLISKVFIATDNEKIKSFNKKIEIFSRSKKSSTDRAQTEMVIREFLLKNKCDYLILIQATNPFLKKKHLEEAIRKILKKKCDTLLSVVNSKFFIWKKKEGLCKPENYKLSKRPRSQDIKENQLIENGSFYIFKRKNFLKFNNRLHGKITYYEMPKESLFEIDEKEDLKIVRNLLK